MTRRAGFTLVEVLLAASLSTVIAVALAGTLAVMHGAQERTRARAERRALLRALEQRIQADLRGVVPPGGLDAAGLIGQSAEREGGEELADPELLQSALAGDALRSGVLPPVDARDRLTLAVNPPEVPFGVTLPVGEGSLWEVIYFIDDDPETEARGLVRQVLRVRDAALLSDPPEPEELAPEVIGLDLLFFDGQEWLETWDSGASELLPQAVSLDLAVVHQDELLAYRVLLAPPTGLPTQLREAAQ